MIKIETYEEDTGQADSLNGWRGYEATAYPGARASGSLVNRNSGDRRKNKGQGANFPRQVQV